MDERRDRVEDLAPLFDPVRRRLYGYVLSRADEVGRDEAARAVGIGRPLAAFHLDKLAEAGLLDVGYRRLSGRSGPGAGRPAKVYRPSGRDLAVTVPPRDYELASRMLLEGLADDARDDVARRKAAARRVGREMGSAARSRIAGEATPPKVRRAVVDILEDRGFQPSETDGEIRLGNCPFHALVDRYRDTVCALNLAMLRGVVDGAGAKDLRARAATAPPGCCVAMRIASRG